MREFNYKMIALARDSRGITQKELSSMLPKLNQPNLSKIERGELGITDESLDSIAKALDYPIDFFYQEEPKSPISNIYFRKRATISTGDMNKIFADLKIILKSIDSILEDIELKEYPKFVFNITEGWTPESAAKRMREIMKLQHGRPVKDLITHIEELGIIVYLYDSANEKFDGLTSYTDNGTPIIFVNKNMPNDRIKFTITHELFHLVLHIPCDIEPWRDYENEANAATSEFLMPATDCRNDLRNLSYNSLGQLKAYWGVSKAFIIRRAKDLNQINESTYKYLMIELGRRGERKNENGFVDIDSPKIIPTILTLLKTELNYSNEDIAKKTTLHLKDYSLLFEPEKSIIKLKVLRNIS